MSDRAEMRIDPAVEDALRIETHGFDYIPESERYLRPKQLFSFWVGANAYLYYLFIGGLVIFFGLSLWQAALAIVLGIAGFIFVGYASVAGARSGLPTLTLTRAAFGVRGNSINSFLAWLELIAFEALNAVFGVFATLALFAKIGWTNPGDLGTVLATLLVIGTSALVAIFGHKLLFLSQKVFAISLTSVLAVVAVLTLDEVDWSHGATVSGSTAFGLFLVAMAVIVAAPLSYFATCADYPRYLPSDTPARQITWYTFAGAAVIILPLTFLGAALATNVDMSDPVAALEPMIPGWLFIVYAIAAAGGAVANNAITFYSSGLTIQSIGVPVKRWVATAIDCVLSTLVVLYILLINEDFYTTTSNFLPILNCWIGPFGAILITDAVLRRFRYDPVAAHTFTPASPYWYAGGVNPRGLISLLVGVTVGLLSVNAPDLQGPISKVLFDGDLSWIAPPLVAALCYWLLSRGTVGTREADVEVREVPA